MRRGWQLQWREPSADLMRCSRHRLPQRGDVAHVGKGAKATTQRLTAPLH